MSMAGPGAPGGAQIGFPPLTPGVRRLLIVMVGVFVVHMMASFVPSLRSGIPTWLGLDAHRWGSMAPFFPSWQVGTYMFLHSDGGLSHILFNMLGLYFFGTMLEGSIGQRRLYTQFFMAGAVGALVHLIVSLISGGGRPVVGASGAVLGLVVACAVMYPRRMVLVLFIPVQLWILATIVVAGDLFAVLVQLRDGGTDGVAHWVHLGGATWGALAARFGWLSFDPLNRLQARFAARKVEMHMVEEAELDRLLQKIQREGIGSLARGERALLKRASARRKR